MHDLSCAVAKHESMNDSTNNYQFHRDTFKDIYAHMCTWQLLGWQSCAGVQHFDGLRGTSIHGKRSSAKISAHSELRSSV